MIQTCPVCNYRFVCKCPEKVTPYAGDEDDVAITNNHRLAKLESLLVEVTDFLGKSIFLIGADKVKALVKDLKCE